MRSVKSELYLFIKTLINGGTYENTISEGIPEIQHFAFWNSELTTNTVGETKDILNFNLHIISPKLTAESGEDDYLDQTDLANNIYLMLQDARFSRIGNIKKIDERPDNDSSVLMDWVISFEVEATNCTVSTLVDANDTEVNPSAPVEKELIINID